MDVSEITRFKPGSLQQGVAPTEGINVNYLICCAAFLWTCVCLCGWDSDLNFTVRRRPEGLGISPALDMSNYWAFPTL